MSEKLSPSEVRKRGYKVLLYADNKQHMRTFVRIRRNPNLRSFFCGCWHIQRWDNGKEIVVGNGKKHCHLVFSFPNPRYWSGVLSDLDLSEQFCRPIGYDRKGTIEGGYIYLTHANSPDKEQYPDSDIFGAPDHVEAARAALLRYRMRHITLAESLAAIRQWVTSHYGLRITPVMFIDWIVKTPYVRSAHNPWVRQLIDDHNWVVSQREHESEFKDATRWASRITIDDLDDWEEII